MRSRKFIYIICLAAIILLNAFYDEPEMLVMFIITVAVGFISWLIYMLSKSQIKLFCLFAEPKISKGDVLVARFKMTNRFKIPMPWCTLNINVEVNNNGGSASYNVLMGENEEKGETPLSIPIEHCGIVRLNIDRLVCRDYMQIFSSSINYNHKNNAAVFPELIQLGENPARQENDEAYYRFSYNESDNTELMELREYREGDALNHIHWNLSAVADDYIIKQYGEEVENCNYIIVDLEKKNTDGFRDDLDFIYSAAYSIGNVYAKLGIKASFLAWDSTKKDIYEGAFKNREQLDLRMTELMEITCGNSATERLEEYIEEKMDMEEQHDNVIIVTSSDSISDDYRVFNVKNADLKEMLMDIAEKI